MDWQQRMMSALEYLERHLRDDLDLQEAAREANCSTYHFIKMFQVVTGMGPAEYVRRRRLSCAAIDLAGGGELILDIALKYGYDSPDSFTRAFKREFDCLPSDARVPGTRLHAYPPLSFTITLKGDKTMEFRIEKKGEYRLTGLGLKVNNLDGTNFKEIPEFWDRVEADGRFKALCAKAGPNLGIVGVCHGFDMKSGDFVYSIAIETPADRTGLPEECEDFVVPASTWAKFVSRGPLRPNFQNTIKQIYSEWLPTSGRELAGTAEVEYYPDLPDSQESDYWCEYWIPLRDKN